MVQISLTSTIWAVQLGWPCICILLMVLTVTFLYGNKDFYFLSYVITLNRCQCHDFYMQEYHDTDIGNTDPGIYLRKPAHPSAIQMKEILWKLATKQLKPADWKKIASYWKFTQEHIRAIEHQYTGRYKQARTIHSEDVILIPAGYLSWALALESFST